MSTPEEIQRVGEILREAGVDTTPSSPGIGEWLAAVQDRIFEALDALVPPGFDATPLARPLLWTLVAVGIGALVMLLVLLLRRPREAAAAAPEKHSESPSEARPQDRDWRAVLSAALDRGDLPEALEATWWVLLSGVGESTRRERATGRAAVRDAGRHELMPLVRDLEALTFGRRPLRRESLEPIAERVCNEVA